MVDSSDNNIPISVHTLLYVFPRNGLWMPGAGKYAALLTELLDAGTTLIEEAVVPTEDGLSTDWIVRLTARGMIERANGNQELAPCAAKGFRTATLISAPASATRTVREDGAFLVTDAE